MSRIPTRQGYSQRNFLLTLESEAQGGLKSVTCLKWKLVLQSINLMSKRTQRDTLLEVVRPLSSVVLHCQRQRHRRQTSAELSRSRRFPAKFPDRVLSDDCSACARFGTPTHSPVNRLVFSCVQFTEVFNDGG